MPKSTVPPFVRSRSLIVDIAGVSISAQERRRLEHPMVAGVILFTRNFKNCNQLLLLVKELKSVLGNKAIIAVDHEGGRVQRFKQDWFTHLPSMQAIADFFGHENKKLGWEKEVQNIGWLMAKECLSVGINVSFAPVLDIDNGSEVIGDRAFSNTPEVVAEYAFEFINGMREAGLPSIGKHFPGHGSTLLDSHLHTPIDERSREEIEDIDLVTFKTMIELNGLDAVMPAHVQFSAIDDKPVGYSHKWLQEILRDDLGFEGAIFSDDLSMVGAGLSTEKPIGYLERYEKAMSAGCDFALICNQPDEVDNLLKKLDDTLHNDHGISHESGAALLFLSKIIDTEETGIQELAADKRYQQTKSLITKIRMNKEC